MTSKNVPNLSMSLDRQEVPDKQVYYSATNSFSERKGGTFLKHKLQKEEK